jgi:ATP-dependent Zn protease
LIKQIAFFESVLILKLHATASWSFNSKRNGNGGTAVHDFFVMVATKWLRELSQAVLQYLPRRILVGMPTIENREGILWVYLKHKQLALDVDISAPAIATQKLHRI